MVAFLAYIIYQLRDGRSPISRFHCARDIKPSTVSGAGKLKLDEGVTMARATGRAVLAAASSAGLLIGGAMSASATASHHDDHGGHGGRNHYGWVKVCQDVKAYDDYQRNDEYDGQYQVKDSYGSVWKFRLEGRYGCRQVKVHKGKVSIKVTYKPEYTYLKGYADRYLNVRRGEYQKTTYEYKALDYGWVKVCQEVKKYGDYGKDDDNDYNGTYVVEDSYGDTTKLYLKGEDDCDAVKVHTGKVDVKVDYQPRYTELKGYDEVYVDVYKGDYETVTFTYRAKDDEDHDY
jgi:hypothetical protein